MKLKHQLLILIATIILLISSSVFVYGLLKSSKSIDNIKFSVGNLAVELKGAMVDEAYIVPGKELIKESYIMINTSTINIDLQMVIDVMLDGHIIDPNVYKKEDNSFNVLILIDDLYRIEETNRYLLTNIQPGTNINIISSLILNGLIVKNDYTGQQLSISISFSVKQSDHAEWSDIGILDLFN